MPPGAIDALIRNAAAANLQIKLDGNDEIVIVKPNGRQIPLPGWGKSAWQEEVKEAISDSFLQLLSIQCSTQNQKGGLAETTPGGYGGHRTRDRPPRHQCLAE